MRRKNRKRNKAYLEWIHTLMCAVCWETDRTSPELAQVVEAHHAGERGLMQKADDRTAIPLCKWHHTDGPEAIHKLGKKFWEHHGLDKEALIREYNAAFDKQ